MIIVHNLPDGYFADGRSRPGRLAMLLSVHDVFGRAIGRYQYFDDHSRTYCPIDGRLTSNGNSQ